MINGAFQVDAGSWVGDDLSLRALSRHVSACEDAIRGMIPINWTLSPYVDREHGVGGRARRAGNLGSGN